MLKRNSCITRLELKLKLVQGCGLLVPLYEGLCANSTLRKLIIARVGTPQPPECAHVDKVPSTDMDAGSLATMLRTNQSLTLLDIMSSGIVCNASVFEDGLSQNCTLEELHIRVDAAGAEALMAALTPVGDTTSIAASTVLLTTSRSGLQPSFQRLKATTPSNNLKFTIARKWMVGLFLTLSWIFSRPTPPSPKSDWEAHLSLRKVKLNMCRQV